MADVIDRISEVMQELGIDSAKACAVSETIRMEFCGSQIYVPKKAEAIRDRMIGDIKNNVPSKEIERRYSVSKYTVYRMMKKIRDKRS